VAAGHRESAAATGIAVRRRRRQALKFEPATIQYEKNREEIGKNPQAAADICRGDQRRQIQPPGCNPSGGFVCNMTAFARSRGGRPTLRFPSPVPAGTSDYYSVDMAPAGK